MALSTTVQKIRDKWSVLCGLDKDDVNPDDASAFIETLNLSIDEIWLSAEWTFAFSVLAEQTDANTFVDLSENTTLSEVIRATAVHPYRQGANNVEVFNNLHRVENAEFDGLYVPNATTAEAVAVTSIASVGTLATCITTATHGYATGDYSIIAGGTESEYNGTFEITVTDTTTFTYVMLTDPSVDTQTGTSTSTKATVFLEHRIATPIYSLVTDTVPRRLENYLSYKTASLWYMGEGQFAKSGQMMGIAKNTLLNEIERLERQMSQQPAQRVGVRYTGYR